GEGVSCGERVPVHQVRGDGLGEAPAGGIGEPLGIPAVTGAAVGGAEAAHPQPDVGALGGGQLGLERARDGALGVVGEGGDPGGGVVGPVLDAGHSASSWTRSPITWAMMVCTWPWSTTPSCAAAPSDCRARPMFWRALTRVSRLDASDPSSHPSTS